MSDSAGMGVGLAVVSGVMNGTFTVPMRYLGRWEWENVWALFILISCVILPAGMVGYFSRGALGVLEDVPAVVVGSAIVCGGAWGFGAIMFGQGVSAIGISLGNSLVLGVSASFGSLVPLWVLQPERIGTPKGIGIIFGTVVTLVGGLLCGVAGRRRERERGEGAVERDRMVGRRRPVGVGILLCAGAGMLSAVFNIGYSVAAPLVEAARARGISEAHASDLVWLLMLGSGSVANFGFCGYLLWRNRSFSRYRLPRSWREYTLTLLMALLWGGSIFVYGGAAARLGRLGPALGWPISLATGLVTANAWGFLMGEWRGVRSVTRGLMVLGLLFLLAAVGILGWAGHIE